MGQAHCLDLFANLVSAEHPLPSQGHASILAKLLGVGRKQAGCLGRGSRNLPYVSGPKGFAWPSPASTAPRASPAGGVLSCCPRPTFCFPALTLILSDSPRARVSQLNFRPPCQLSLRAKLRVGTMLSSFLPLTGEGGVTDPWMWGKGQNVCCLAFALVCKVVAMRFLLV